MSYPVMQVVVSYRNEDQQYQGVLRDEPTLTTGEGLQLQCNGTGSAE